MKFFTAQDKARKNTSKLVFLFVIAVLSLILLTNVLLIGTFAYMGANETGEAASLSLASLNSYFRLDVFIAVSLGVCILITLGSIYKVMALSKGGQAIAEMLGGHLIPQSTDIHEYRQLLNIVEEMAIASGTPIPKVYLLNEPAINAFAAGQSHNNAVIGVTKGALKQLSRDELQGVIAHEFSHILNGDMRLNLRLIGILHGVLLLGIIGEYIVRSFRHGSGSRKNGGAIIMLGIGLMVIGYAGTFFGKWIKASVSRQREYLADASAVQFTRNKDTIAGALKKIGGLEEGSMLESPAAPEYSHAYFASGVSTFLESMLATHPPLNKRIKSIDPNWDGEYILPKPVVVGETEKNEEKVTNVAMPVTAAILTGIDQVINQIGTINETDIEYVHDLILGLPELLRSSSKDAYSARAMIYALLIREQKDKAKAWKVLKQYADKTMPELTKELINASENIDEEMILPLLEFCVNALRELSEKQYKQFRITIDKIITSDNTVDLNEWVIQRLVMQQLDEHFSLRKPAKQKHSYLGAIKNEAEIILSLIAYSEHKDNEELAKQAFERGVKEIGAHAFNIIPKNDLALKNINNAVEELMRAKTLLKPKILKACAATILSDGKTTRKGVELFRTLSICLDCPVPPLKI